MDVVFCFVYLFRIEVNRIIIDYSYCTQLDIYSYLLTEEEEEADPKSRISVLGK